MIGTTLSHYRITSKLGEGGMGVVYRAVDTKLDRDVAIKVLPESVAASQERLDRLEREAKALAALNHPNIAAIYSIESVSQGDMSPVSFLVMELVEGDDLAARIAQAPLSVEEVVAIALQIAEALESAHERAIIHRDLKPGNIRLTPAGVVKLLDFGLAKRLVTDPLSVDSRSPTLSVPQTEAGTLIGTVAYMSPEQARGLPLDNRSDLWSFGVVLWEMITGTRPFRGDTASDILAAVLSRDPDSSLLPTDLPVSLHRLLRRCLERDPHRRLHHVGDARLELYDAIHPSEPIGTAPDEDGSNSQPPVEKNWRLSTELLRHLERESLDPSIVGDHLPYLDNCRSADVLVVFEPGFAQSHLAFGEILERLPYRGIAVPPYGLGHAGSRRTTLSIADQLTILGFFLRHLHQSLSPTTMLLAGFSSGADLILRFAAESTIDDVPVHGLLPLSPNLSLETCFFTKRIAELPENAGEEMFQIVRNLSAEAQTSEEWLSMTPFFLEILKQHRTDLSPLRHHAREIVAPFAASDLSESPLAGWYRKVKQSGLGVRLVFASVEGEQVPLREFLLNHIDRGVLGPDFEDDDFVTETATSHFDLIRPRVIETNLDALLQSLRAADPSSES